ncbi:MAG: mannose-1-phosphate guanylyltransferase [Bacteroidetes bacterium]|nr:mannose-1-phosphate guanylyltransferase [Bacteroidota bacterium]
MRVFAVIMAGGVGSRFWPKSREAMPKQFQNVFGERSLYQRTYDRISEVVTPENTFVVTNRLQQPAASAQLPQLPAENIIVEPFGRNTAPCIAVAASAISSITEDAVMVVLPSDHLISQEENFVSQLKDAVRLADKERSLVTLGIRPTHPETGFGYIHFDPNTEQKEALDHVGYNVIEFREKPNLETAISFLASGDYLWNSGMFIWRVDVILEELKRNLTHFADFHSPLKSSFGKAEFAKQLEEFYLRVQSISVDYAVMEKAKNVLTIPSSFTWSDVGSWDEVYKLGDRNADGNSLKGDVVSVRSLNNLIWTEEKMFALVGVENLIVVETKDAVLICKRGESQGVKEIVEILMKQDRQDLV